MKRRMARRGKNRDMTGSGCLGKSADRAVCAVLVLCAALLFTACAGEENAAGQAGKDAAWLGGAEAAAGQSGQNEDWLAERMRQDRRTRQDLRTEPEDMERTERIDLSAYESGRVILSGSGDMWLSGSLDGQVVIDAQEDELVHLYLAGVEITSLKGPAMQIQEAAKVIVTLVSDTENVLSDSPDYKDFEETPACLYSACDLTINGGGALRVYGYHGDGIRSKDRIRLLDGTFAVHAKGDGIRGNDGIYMWEASVDIESEKNGLRTVNQGADDRGVIEINGGTLSAVAGKNGVCAASDLYLYRGKGSIKAVEEKVRTEGTAYIAEGFLK